MLHLLQFIDICPAVGIPKPDTVSGSDSTSAEQRIITPLTLWATLSFSQGAPGLLQFQGTQVALVQLTVHWAPGCLRTAAPQPLCLQPATLQSSAFLGAGLTVHSLSLLNFISSLSMPSSQQSRFPWLAALPSSMPTQISSNLVSSANLVRVASTPSSRPLKKMFNRTGHRTDPSSTLLFTSSFTNGPWALPPNETFTYLVN